MKSWRTPVLRANRVNRAATGRIVAGTVVVRAAAVIVVDGAQAVPHLAVNFDALDIDFYAFSGHKLLGPMGIGVLVGRRTLLVQGTKP